MLISSQGYGQLAQSVEQRPEKPRVRSSILRLPTIPSSLIFKLRKILKFAIPYIQNMQLEESMMLKVPHLKCWQRQEALQFSCPRMN